MKPSIEIQIQGKTKTFPPGITPAEILRQNHVSGDVIVDLVARRGSCHDYHASGARLPEDLEKMEARVKGLVEAAPERKISCITILSDKHRGKGSLAIRKRGEEKMSELSVQQFVRQFGEEVANRS